MRIPPTLLLLLCPALIRLDAQPGPDAFAAQADAVVQSWARDRQFRGAVLVAKDGKPVFRKAYGNANDEWDIANTPETKFRLGSITKQFTAAAILQLAEQGKLKLEDPVKLHYPEAPAAWEAITVHHLLNHTSGIPSYTDQNGFFSKQSRDPRTPGEIVKLTQDLPLQFTPGEKMRYNNTGYILLGAIIEKVTGQTYADYLRKAIFGPAGMKDSGYDTHAAILKKRAVGYEPDGTHAPYLDMTLPYAAGSLYSTVDDLLRWDAALHGGKLLRPESLQKMTTPGLSDYGYGLTIRKLPNGKLSIAHGGGINGFNTFMARFPEEKLLVIALANQNGPAAQTIALDLARLYFGEDVKPRPLLTEIQLPAEQLEPYVGSYQLGPGAILKVTREGARLHAQLTGQPKFEIFPSAVDQFFLKVVDARLAFSRDGAGKVTGLTLFQNGREIKAARAAE